MINGLGQQLTKVQLGGAATEQAVDSNQPTREPYRIEVAEALPFNGILKTDYITTDDLGKKINEMFRSAFPVDFEACFIEFKPEAGMTQPALYLYFKDKGRLSSGFSGVKALLPIGAKQGSTTGIDRILAMNSRLASKRFDLSIEAKEMLSEFYRLGKNEKVNWKNVVTEVTTREGYSDVIYVKIFGLDIMKVIRKLYGEKTVVGNFADYSLRVVNTTPNNVGQMATNFLLEIQQLDTKELQKLTSKIGLIPTQGGIPMIR